MEPSIRKFPKTIEPGHAFVVIVRLSDSLDWSRGMFVGLDSGPHYNIKTSHKSAGWRSTRKSWIAGGRRT